MDLGGKFFLFHRPTAISKVDLGGKNWGVLSATGGQSTGRKVLLVDFSGFKGGDSLFL